MQSHQLPRKNSCAEDPAIALVGMVITPGICRFMYQRKIFQRLRSGKLFLNKKWWQDPELNRGHTASTRYICVSICISS
jgi:hypothetical protein